MEGENDFMEDGDAGRDEEDEDEDEEEEEEEEEDRPPPVESRSRKRRKKAPAAAAAAASAKMDVEKNAPRKARQKRTPRTRKGSGKASKVKAMTMATATDVRELSLFVCTDHAAVEGATWSPTSLVVEAAEQSAERLLVDNLQSQGIEQLEKPRLIRIDQGQGSVHFVQNNKSVLFDRVKGGSTKVYTCVDHATFPGSSVATVVVASSPSEAKRMLDLAVSSEMGFENKGDSTLTEIDMTLPRVISLSAGYKP